MRALTRFWIFALVREEEVFCFFNLFLTCNGFSKKVFILSALFLEFSFTSCSTQSFLIIETLITST